MIFFLKAGQFFLDQRTSTPSHGSRAFFLTRVSEKTKNVLSSKRRMRRFYSWLTDSCSSSTGETTEREATATTHTMLRKPYSLDELRAVTQTPNLTTHRDIHGRLPLFYAVKQHADAQLISELCKNVFFVSAPAAEEENFTMV